MLTEAESKRNEDLLEESIIEEVARSVQEVVRDSVLSTAIEVGRIVIERLYDGEIAAWQEGGGRDLSFRKLAARLSEGPASQEISAAGVYRSCGVYALEQRLGVSALKHITATHAYAVLGLPVDQQKALLQRANDEMWSSRKLEGEKRSLRSGAGSRRGRPRLPAFVRSIRSFRKLLDQPDETFGQLELIDQLSQSQVSELRTLVSTMKQQCEQLEKSIEEHLTDGEALVDAEPS